EALDDRGIAKVHLFIDDKIPPGGELLYEPYEYIWNTEQYPDSTPHVLYARAYDTDSNSTVSQKISIVTYRFSPSNLSVSVVNDTVLRFTWNDNSSHETAFQLFESINDSGFILKKTLPPNTVTTDIQGTYTANIRYVYMMRAVQDTIKSKFTNTQIVYVVLSPPMGLNVHTLTDTLIELRWQQGTNSFEEYVEVEQRIGSGSYVKMATIPSGTRSVTLTGTYKTGTTYYFRARAFSKYNISAYSNIVSQPITFPAPSGIVVDHVSPGSAKISWKDNTLFEKGFSVERLTYGVSAFAEVFRTGPNDTAWTDTSMDSTLEYQWRVRAFTDSNLSSYSLPVFAGWFPSYTKKLDLSYSAAPVTAVKFVPNSALVITTHSDDAVNIWNADNGTPVQSIKPVTNGVFALAVSPDGNLMATGGGDGTIKIWNVSGGALQRTIAAHTGRVRDLHFNPAGTLLASAGADSMARVWNVSNGLIHSAHAGHTDSVAAVRFHPNGTDIVSGGKDNALRYWNAGNGALLWNKTFQLNGINTAEFNSDGSRIVIGQTTTFWNPIVVLTSAGGDTATYFNRLSTSSYALAYSPDDRTLVSCGYDGFIGTFSLKRPFMYSNISTGSGALRALAYNSTNTHLVTGGLNGTITVWSIGNRWTKFTP
ncbi:MAG: hypothetical protein ACYC09_05140, partial [Bacteroidota bacterium]